MSLLKYIKTTILLLLTFLLGAQTTYAKTEALRFEPLANVIYLSDDAAALAGYTKLGTIEEVYVAENGITKLEDVAIYKNADDVLAWRGLANAGGKLDNLIIRLDNLELTNLKLKLNDLDEAAKIRLANDLDGLSDNAIKQLEDNFGLLNQWKQIDALSVSAQASQKPIWFQKILDGNEFNTIRSSSYPNNEVYLINPNNPSKYVRLDSYIDGSEIVSRKYTQFADIQESTGIKYIQELKDKYPPGTKIADVPSNKAGGTNSLLQPKINDGISGQMILEVPVQNNPIPPSVLNEANSWGIIIRDVQGTIY